VNRTPSTLQYDKSLINCVDFFTLNEFGSCKILLKYLLINFPKLYARELHKLIIGLMGMFSVCNLTKPLILGGVGFMHFDFHFSFSGIILLAFIIYFTCF
jgi:hypothetical protein